MSLPVPDIPRLTGFANDGVEVTAALNWAVGVVTDIVPVMCNKWAEPPSTVATTGKPHLEGRETDSIVGVTTRTDVESGCGVVGPGSHGGSVKPTLASLANGGAVELQRSSCQLDLLMADCRDLQLTGG